MFFFVFFDKRRQDIKYDEFENYITYSDMSYLPNTQVSKEIHYMVMREYLKPKILITYSRKSYKCGDIRITFDHNVCYSTGYPKLTDKAINRVLSEGEYIMEIKTPHNLPLWLCDILGGLKIYPTKFSKFKTAYLKSLKEKLC